MSTNCDTCIHAHELPKLEGGNLVCRANPPTPFLVPAQGGGAQLLAFFPPVSVSMTCSLYEADIVESEAN